MPAKPHRKARTRLEGEGWRASAGFLEAHRNSLVAVPSPFEGSQEAPGFKRIDTSVKCLI
jgi:hypothetical protein